MNDSQKFDPSIPEIIDHIRVNGVYNQQIRELRIKKITAFAAQKNGITVSDEELQRAADTFRIINDLTEAKTFKDWLKSVDMKLDNFETYLERNILISKFKDTLVEKANKKDYIQKQVVEEAIREEVYNDWLAENMQ